MRRKFNGAQAVYRRRGADCFFVDIYLEVESEGKECSVQSLTQAGQTQVKGNHDWVGLTLFVIAMAILALKRASHLHWGQPDLGE